ncbi:MAG: phospho-sugar mutase [Clostridiales bacterium]|nr:phospho-sugar mutase [Clostridiales bacterium]
MSDYRSDYERWCNSSVLSDYDKRELAGIANDEKEIEERFYRELEFGTAGMRGILGIGKNRMNIYNVRRAAQGVAKYVKDENSSEKGVLIGYDTRNFSRIFAEETAKTLAANGVKAYLFDTVHSVPEVSFGIREMGCGAGVMITASHNPKEYNGFKAYGPDGGQLPPEAAQIVIDAIAEYDVFEDVKVISLEDAKEKGLLDIVGPELNEKFLETIKTQQINPDAVYEVADTMKLVYTPFHGTGARPIKEILKRIGFKNVLVVKEQDNEDGNFSTVKSPNPENAEGFALAIKLAKENDVDLIIGTDPDCDRVGIVVRDSEGVYRTLTGNQTGALLVEYILRARKEQNKLPADGVVIKTIVTTELAAAIAKAYDIEIMSLLTGFKYIGEKMTEFAEKKNHTFLIGFEESYGYLVGNHARDKDGVVATMLIAEMAAYYRTKGMTLYDALQNIYKKYGYYAERTISFTMPGKDGMEKMSDILVTIRKSPITEVIGMGVKNITDYERDETGLPRSNVLKYELSDSKTYFIIRPSGTEPKIKLYIGTSANSMDEGNALIDRLAEDVKGQMHI